MKRDLRTPSAQIVRILMILYVAFNVAVLLYVIYNSMRLRPEFLSHTFALTDQLSLQNYEKLIVSDAFFRYFLNSLYILAGALLLSTALSTTVAYGIGHYGFRLKKFFRTYFLIGLMFPIQLSIVPVFLMMKDIGLINSYLSVILICGASISMSVFLLTSFFEKLPNEIYEAAVIDGAGEYGIFIKIMFPLAKPIVFSMGIITSVGIWNQFFVPLIFLQSDVKKTLPLLVMKYTKKLMMTMDSAFAVSVLTIVPILILFAIFSKKILEGIAEGGVKG